MNISRENQLEAFENFIASISAVYTYTIETSGYYDRFLMSKVVFTGDLLGSKMQWNDHKDCNDSLYAVGSLIGLSNKLISDLIMKNFNVKFKNIGTYKSVDRMTTTTTMIDPKLIQQYLSYKRSLLGGEIDFNSDDVIQSLSQDEKAFIRYHFDLCNDKNLIFPNRDNKVFVTEF